MTMAIPVKFFPGFFSCEKFILLSPIPTFFCCYQTHKTRQKAKSRIRDIGELYLRILFFPYIFTPSKRRYLSVKTGKKCNQKGSAAGMRMVG
jgi:hypothetical protein